jgi:hypothetical protein
VTKINVHCHSSNLIYVITCKTCGKHYVGETKRKLFERLYEHLRNINLAIDAHLDKRGRPVDDNIHPVGLHFAQPDHNGTKDLRIQVLDFVNFHPDSKKAGLTRLRVEKKWIHTLRSPAPNGINIMD